MPKQATGLLGLDPCDEINVLVCAAIATTAALTAGFTLSAPCTDRVDHIHSQVLKYGAGFFTAFMAFVTTGDDLPAYTKIGIPLALFLGTKVLTELSHAFFSQLDILNPDNFACDTFRP